MDEPAGRLSLHAWREASYQLPPWVQHRPIFEVYAILDGLAAWQEHSGRHLHQELPPMRRRLLALLHSSFGGDASGWTIDAIEALAAFGYTYPVRIEPDTGAERHFSITMAAANASILLQPPVERCLFCCNADGQGVMLTCMAPKVATVYVSAAEVQPALHYSRRCCKCGRGYYYDKYVERMVAAPDAADAGAGDEPERIGRRHVFYPGLRRFTMAKGGHFALDTAYAHDCVISLGRNHNSCTAQADMMGLTAFRRSTEAGVSSTSPLGADVFREIIGILAVCKARQGGVPGPYFWLAEGGAPYPPVANSQSVAIEQRAGDVGHQWLGLQAALHQFNEECWTSGPGFVWSLHRCRSCVQPVDLPSGGQARLYASCLDGVTLGHKSCAARRCTNAMPSGWVRRFCDAHAQMEEICAVISCQRPCQPAPRGSRACTEHGGVDQAFQREKAKGGYMARAAQNREERAAGGADAVLLRQNPHKFKQSYT
eukprot:TRINITY_DN895_c0_g1_i2.p1 TRINITY_DN895_c0_g1~~TRINITY_DN895_c0_g1_i2.p1  ORF type:complete len:495 (-),score=52.11 TRINITY_DN895_c0_g1_i2:695-2149(-)